MRLIALYIGCFAAGLAAGLTGNWLASIYVICGAIVVASFVGVWFKWGELTWKEAAICIIMAAAAVGYGLWSNEANHSIFPMEIEDQDIVITGEVVSAVTVDGDKATFELGTRQVVWQESSFEWEERVQVTIYLQSEAEQAIAQGWSRGNMLMMHGTLSRPSEARNFGDFDYRTYLRTKHIHWQFSNQGLDGMQVNQSFRWRMSNIMGLVDQLRAYLTKQLDQMYDGVRTGFMKGLLVGDQTDIAPDVYNRFSDIGLTHVLAISGLHVGIIIAGCYWLLRRLRLTKERTLIICIWLLPVYVVCTGAAPSAIRAGLMAGLGLYAVKRNRLKDSLRFLALAAFIMLVWNPYYLYSISFQLSYAVTFGIITLTPKLMRWLPIRSAFLSGAVSLTLVAQIVSFPLTIYYFHQFHLLSVVANLLLVPLVSMIILPAGMIGMLAGAVFPFIGGWIATLVSLFIDLLLWLTEWFAGWRFMKLIWPQPAAWWLVLYGVLLLSITWLYPLLRNYGLRNTAKVALCLLCASFAALLLYGYEPDMWVRNGTVSILDVGQGDAILIRTPQGRNILLDGGGTLNFGRENAGWRQRKDPFEIGKDSLVPLLKRRGIHRLDAVIISHNDGDHIGGLRAVLREIPVQKILFNGTWESSEFFEELIGIALQREIPLIPANAGQEWQVDDQTAMLFLNPDQSGYAVNEIHVAADQNEESIVCLMTMYDSTFLFTGDIGEQTEKRLLANSNIAALLPNAGIDVLKVAHHGSKYSTTLQWLRDWKPGSAVISVGRNNLYGHPTMEVLSRLRSVGLMPFRTDLNGEVQYLVDHEGLKVRTMIK